MGSPTNAVDLAHVIAQILSKDNYSYGIYNFSNEGRCSWFDFALKKIKEFLMPASKLIPSPAMHILSKYSLLDKTKLKSLPIRNCRLGRKFRKRTKNHIEILKK